MGELCVGDDAGWAGDPPLPVDPPHCVGQKNIVTSDAITSDGTGCLVCSGPNGELRFYSRQHWSRTSGASFGVNLNWTTHVAGTTTTFGLEVLAGKVNGCGVFGDYSYMSGEELTPGWNIPRIWRNKKQRYGLVGEVCPHCEHKIFPPRDVCPYCGDEARSTIQAVAEDENGDTTRVLAMRNQVSE